MTQPLFNLGPEDAYEDHSAQTDHGSEASSSSSASTESHAESETEEPQSSVTNSRSTSSYTYHQLNAPPPFQASSSSEASTKSHANIMLHLYNGSMSLHIFDLKLDGEDLENAVRHVTNVTAFTYIDRYSQAQSETLTKLFRDAPAIVWRVITPMRFPNSMVRLKKALSPAKTPRPLAAAPVIPIGTAASKAF